MRRIFNIDSTTTGIIGVVDRISDNIDIIDLTIGHKLEIVVNHSKTVGRQSIDQLELCTLHVFN